MIGSNYVANDALIDELNRLDHKLLKLHLGQRPLPAQQQLLQVLLDDSPERLLHSAQIR